MSQFYVSSTYLKILSTDQDVVTLIESAGLDLQALMAEEFISSIHLQRLFHAFADRGLDSLTLRFGAQFSVATHGPLGFAFLTAPTLKTAMQCLADYTITRSSNYACRFYIDSDRAYFSTHDQSDDPLVLRWLAEAAMYVDVNLLKNYISQPLADGLCIEFAFPAPPYSQELEAFLGAPCTFGAERTQMSFPAAWCRMSSPLSDEDTHRNNLQKCRELKLRLASEQDSVSICALALEQFFEARRLGQATSRDLPDLQTLAELQHCSVRTLARRLEKQDCSYKQLLEQTRQQQAKHLLLKTPLTIAEIGDLLAYRETASFVRAFKTWFDTSPAAWRKSTYERNSISTG